MQILKDFWKWGLGVCILEKAKIADQLLPQEKLDFSKDCTQFLSPNSAVHSHFDLNTIQTISYHFEFNVWYGELFFF